MRDQKRITRILKLIGNVWENNPDLRLCQLISNLFPRGDDIFYVEDEELERYLLRGTYENQKRKSNSKSKKA